MELSIIARMLLRRMQQNEGNWISASVGRTYNSAVVELMNATLATHGTLHDCDGIKLTLNGKSFKLDPTPTEAQPVVKTPKKLRNNARFKEIVWLEVEGTEADLQGMLGEDGKPKNMDEFEDSGVVQFGGTKPLGRQLPHGAAYVFSIELAFQNMWKGKLATLLSPNTEDQIKLRDLRKCAAGLWRPEKV